MGKDRSTHRFRVKPGWAADASRTPEPEAPTNGWERRELVGKRCDVCDMRTTHDRGACLRCAQVLPTRRLARWVLLAGVALFAAGIGLLLRMPDARAPWGLLVALAGVLLTAPATRAVVTGHWPSLDWFFTPEE